MSKTKQIRHIQCLLVFASFMALIATSPVYPFDVGDQLFKLLPEDGGVDEWFGRSVAISGTTAVVGANYDQGNGTSGSAYLFDTTTGQQIAKLLASDGEEFDNFGYSVAISGTTAIVGAYRDDDNGSDSGSAYLFDSITGKQLFKLLPNDGTEGDRFGHYVAISGATAIVGSYWDDDNGSDSGSAYLFDITTGKQLFKLLPNDGAEDDWFGVRVAISDTTAIVSAWHDDDNGDSSGSVYLFDIATGQQIAKILAVDGAEGDKFGTSVALTSTMVIIGAYWDDDFGSNSGSAYLFDITSGELIAKYIPLDGESGDMFGVSVAISGDTVIVGAYKDDNSDLNSGSAYLYSTASTQPIAKLTPNDPESENHFGVSVSISGNTAIVGSYWDDDNGLRSGSAYTFDAAINPCPWDLDGSVLVGTGDLLELFAQWGSDGPADFNESGVVDTSDLLILFANWGPCP